MIQTVKKVESRNGNLLRVRRSLVPHNAEGEQFVENSCHVFKRDPLDHVVCAGGCERMLSAKTGIDPPQEDGSSRMSLTSGGDRFFHARIPIGHEGGHENSGGLLHFLQGIDKELFWNPVSAIRSGDVFEGRRPRGFFPAELAGAVSMAGQDAVFERRMMRIQAVDEVDVESASPQIPGQIKKAQGL